MTCTLLNCKYTFVYMDLFNCLHDVYDHVVQSSILSGSQLLVSHTSDYKATLNMGIIDDQSIFPPRVNS